MSQRKPEGPRPMMPPQRPPKRSRRARRRRFISKRHISAPSGAKRYNYYIERDKQKEYYLTKLDEQEGRNTPDVGEDELELKANNSFISIDKELKDEENPYLIAQEDSLKAYKRAVIMRKCLITLLCIFLSLGLNIFSFHFPFTPSVINIDFSAFPELLITLAVNPLAGVLVILVKNGLYYLLVPGSLASLPNKIILDTVFVLTAFLFFKLINKSKVFEKRNIKRENKELPDRDYSFLSVLLGGTAGSIFASLVSVITVKKLLFPMLYEYFGNQGYNPESVLENYESAYIGMTKTFPMLRIIAPSLETLDEGIWIYNVPLTFFKYFVCALFTAFIFSFIYDFVRKRSK